MRTTNVTTTGPSTLQMQVTAPDPLVLMYSPQLVRVTTGGAPSSATAVRVTLMNRAQMRAHAETRAFFKGEVEFDVSRIMQLLATPVELVLGRVDFGGDLSESYTLTVEFIDTDGNAYELASYDDILALYGSLDAGETYGAETQRRLWLSLPQTFTALRPTLGTQRITVKVDGVTYGTGDTDGRLVSEVNLVQILQDNGVILSGRANLVAEFSARYVLSDGEAGLALTRDITLVPESCPADAGVYLRWLNREGGVSYWLFKRSQSRVTSAVRSSYETHLSGVPGAPVNNIYRNARKADYREGRELVLGAVGLSTEEHADLCTLATSPAVEMLALPEGYDGGRLEGPQKWMQVTVTAGTYARDIRRETPSRQDLEFIIELPERNTARL